MGGGAIWAWEIGVFLLKDERCGLNTNVKGDTNDRDRLICNAGARGSDSNH